MGRPAPWGGFRAGESCRVRGVDADGCDDGPLGGLAPGSGHAGGAALRLIGFAVSPSSRLAGRGVWVGSGGVGRPGFAKGRCEPLCPPGAVPVRLPDAGGDSFG